MEEKNGKEYHNVIIIVVLHYTRWQCVFWREVSTTRGATSPINSIYTFSQLTFLTSPFLHRFAERNLKTRLSSLSVDLDIMAGAASDQKEVRHTWSMVASLPDDFETFVKCGLLLKLERGLRESRERVDAARIVEVMFSGNLQFSDVTAKCPEIVLGQIEDHWAGVS